MSRIDLKPTSTDDDVEGVTASTPDQRPLWKKKRFLTPVALIVVLFVAIAATGGSSSTLAPVAAATTSTTVVVPTSCVTTAKQVAADPNGDVATTVDACKDLTVGQWRVLAASMPGSIALGNTDPAEVAAIGCWRNAAAAASTLCTDTYAKCAPKDKSSDGWVTTWACRKGE